MVKKKKSEVAEKPYSQGIAILIRASAGFIFGSVFGVLMDLYGPESSVKSAVFSGVLCGLILALVLASSSRIFRWFEKVVEHLMNGF